MIPLLPEMPPLPGPNPAGLSGPGALALAGTSPGGATGFASLLDSALPPEPPAPVAAVVAAPMGPLHDEETGIAAGTVRLSILPAKSEPAPGIRLPTGRILPQAGAFLPPARVPDAVAAGRAVLTTAEGVAPTPAGDADEPAPRRPLPLDADAPDPSAPFPSPVSNAAPAAVSAPARLEPESGRLAGGEPNDLPHADPEDAHGTAAEQEPEPEFAGCGMAPTLLVTPFDRPIAAPPAPIPPEAPAKPAVSPATVVQGSSVRDPAPLGVDHAKADGGLLTRPLRAATPPVSLPAEANLAPAAPSIDAGKMPVAPLRAETPACSPPGLSIPPPVFVAGATEEAALAVGAASLPSRAAVPRRAGVPLPAIPPVMPDAALLTGLAAALPDATPIESATGAQFSSATTAPLLLAASGPPPAPAPLVKPRADTPAAAPQQQSTIEQLGDLREALRAQRPAMVLNHAEFGAVSMRLEAGGSEGWRAVLASRDPGFVPAIQQALAERAVAAAASPESGLSSGHQGASHNGTGEPRSGSSPSGGQGGSQPYFGQSGPRDGEAAPDHRRPSTAAALAARADAEDGGSAGSTSQSGGLFA
jgi:hypothetical protein